MQTLDYHTVLQAVDFEREAVYTNYSGRFMYGATCFGIVGDTAQFARFMVVLGALTHNDDTVMDLLDVLREDNMGMDRIYYFPGFTLENVPQEDDNE